MASQIELYKLQVGADVPTGSTASVFGALTTATTNNQGLPVGPWLQAHPIYPFSNDSSVTVSGSATADGFYYTGGRFYAYRNTTKYPK